MTMLTILVISIAFIVSNYLVASFLSQTLMVVLDIFFFILMHLIINFFIRRKEKNTDARWKRAYML